MDNILEVKAPKGVIMLKTDKNNNLYLITDLKIRFDYDGESGVLTIWEVE